MCRMLGMVSRKPIPSMYLRDFRILAEKGKVLHGMRPGHRDGWGIVYFDNGAPKYLDRRPTNAIKDERYDLALKQIDELGISGVLLAHLRKRSVGRVALENTLPFIIGKWCFTHNGTIYDFHVRVEDEGKSATDSKRFFRLLVKDIETSGDGVEDVISRVVADIKRGYRYSSLTFLLSDGTNLYAYRDISETKKEDYYGLMYAKDDQMVIFTQEPIWKKDWEIVSNRCLVICDKELRIKSFELEQ